jgi:hypothetical protein
MKSNFFKHYILPLLLSLSLIYFSTGFVFIHFLMTEFVKSMNQDLIVETDEDDELCLLVFDKNQIKEGTSGMIRMNEKELRYNDVVYDIVQIIEKEERIYFYCVYDNEENLIEDIFNQNYQDSDTSNKNTSPLKILKSQLLTDYLISDGIYCCAQLHFDEISLRINQQTLNLTLEVLTPPPVA